MRFQPIMVPRPSATATANLTQIGMNLVTLSMLDLSLAEDLCSSGFVELVTLVDLPERFGDEVEIAAQLHTLIFTHGVEILSSGQLGSEISRHLVPTAAQVRSVSLTGSLQVAG